MKNNNKEKLIDSFENIDPDYIDSAAEVYLGIPPKKNNRQYLRYIGLVAAAAMLLFAILFVVLLSRRAPEGPALTSLNSTLINENPVVSITNNTAEASSRAVVTTPPTHDGWHDGFYFAKIGGQGITDSTPVTQTDPSITSAATYDQKGRYPAFILEHQNRASLVYNEKNASMTPIDPSKDQLYYSKIKVDESVSYAINSRFNGEGWYVFYNSNSFYYESYDVVSSSLLLDSKGNVCSLNLCMINGKVLVDNDYRDVSAMVLVEVDVN